MKIAIADYISACNSSGQPVGHGKKVLEEAVDLLKDCYDEEVFCHNSYQTDYSHTRVRNLKHFVLADNVVRKQSLKVKLSDYISKSANIIQIFRQTNADCIWFTNIDRFFLLFLCMIPTNKKIVVTVYRDLIKDSISQGNGIKNKIKTKLLLAGVNKISLIIKTNENLEFTVKSIFVPDYMYTDYYKKYASVEKENLTVCVGTMRKRNKNLLGLISAYKDKKYKLYIAGSFFDKDEYKECNRNQSENIIIKDCILSNDEYYGLLARAKYVVLPYNMSNYTTATSGVLQETIFMKAIPIAPKQLLDFNSIRGLGYDEIEEIPELLEEENKGMISIENNLMDYELDVIRAKITDAIAELFCMESL